MNIIVGGRMPGFLSGMEGFLSPRVREGGRGPDEGTAAPSLFNSASRIFSLPVGRREGRRRSSADQGTDVLGSAA